LKEYLTNLKLTIEEFIAQYRRVTGDNDHNFLHLQNIYRHRWEISFWDVTSKKHQWQDLK